MTPMSNDKEGSYTFTSLRV